MYCLNGSGEIVDTYHGETAYILSTSTKESEDTNDREKNTKNYNAYDKDMKIRDIVAQIRHHVILSDASGNYQPNAAQLKSRLISKC
ncbi:hypothetical protein T265_08064 [Opisthorchis viverrini]|uniref:Uncharacterized protein n=1 Tax=Opisthorchis viverrini TaxID=6198 RepID=A0A074ZAT8_OPIVI|nr:hypothetical protein T265_08064 [Opisthorchis viverrini]KER24218.1 hypothetical protein T265_08064 [Opisthorchis viverrini]